jgi:hypothetical protein
MRIDSINKNIQNDNEENNKISNKIFDNIIITTRRNTSINNKNQLLGNSKPQNQNFIISKIIFSIKYIK